MSNTVFSVALDALSMAKLEEIKNRYPEKSRNGVIKHLIKLHHVGFIQEVDQEEVKQHLIDQIREKSRQCQKLQKNLERYITIYGELHVR